jgi:hypothetical protein
VEPEPKKTMPCSVCGMVKGRDGFQASIWKNCHRRGRCRACLSERSKLSYHNGGEKQRMESARQRRMAVVNAIKAERGCRDCKEHDPACLDFHHRDPSQKSKGIGTLVCGMTNVQRILEEVAKCDVICSNCHRKWHRDKRLERKKTKPERVEAQQTLRLA